MGFVVNFSHVSDTPSSSQLFLCSLSWETVLYKLLQSESFLQAMVPHELLQHGSFPWSSPSGTYCSCVSISQDHKSF